MVEEIRSGLSGRIRRARRDRLKMPQDEFGHRIAQLMGRPRAFNAVTISNWETGRQEPSWEALVAIAQLARLPLEYFAGLGEPEDYPRTAEDGVDEASLEPRLRMLLAWIPRQDAAYQRLVLALIESLLDVLRDESTVASDSGRLPRTCQMGDRLA